jgi:ribosomal small subunit protein bTHX
LLRDYDLITILNENCSRQDVSDDTKKISEFVFKKEFAIIADNYFNSMGRGDKKTAKGKRTIGSFGVSRSKGKIKAQLKRAASKKPAAEAPAADAKPRKVSKKKAEA